MKKFKKQIMMIVKLLDLCFVLFSCSESCIRSCKDMISDLNGGL